MENCKKNKCEIKHCSVVKHWGEGDRKEKSDVNVTTYIGVKGRKGEGRHYLHTH